MDSFDVDLVRTFLSENKLFQAASMVPTMVIKLLEDSLFQIHNQFKAILMGGAALPAELINRSVTRGIPIVSSYGMTETCAQIAANPLLKPLGVYIPKKSVGFIFEPNELEIRDDRGVVQPRVESGQIWLKGPQIFDGYYNPDLNKNAFDDKGWFNTGDYGHLNRLGQLFIENRRTDIIITGGENVNPVEVEETLNQFEEIKESAVTGIPDIEWGEKLVALIVSENGKTIQPDSIKSKLRLKLSAFKIPKVFKTIESLPKTELGKIKRNKLHDFFDSNL
jgi:O-succinylbenzoic acid--CoA ligase